LLQVSFFKYSEETYGKRRRGAGGKNMHLREEKKRREGGLEIYTQEEGTKKG